MATGAGQRGISKAERLLRVLMAGYTVELSSGWKVRVSDGTLVCVMHRVAQDMSPTSEVLVPFGLTMTDFLASAAEMPDADLDRLTASLVVTQMNAERCR